MSASRKKSGFVDLRLSSEDSEKPTDHLSVTQTHAGNYFLKTFV